MWAAQVQGRVGERGGNGPRRCARTRRRAGTGTAGPWRRRTICHGGTTEVELMHLGLIFLDFAGQFQGRGGQEAQGCLREARRLRPEAAVLLRAADWLPFARVQRVSVPEGTVVSNLSYASA